MIRILRLAAALFCAAVFSQFPAFSDQYLQRLGGQVDALTQVAEDFDGSARKVGLTREQALAELSGSGFRAAHRADMQRVFVRLERARNDLEMLRAAAPLERLLLPHRLRDPETLGATWQDFRPAIPVTSSGLISAAIGFALGWLALGLPGLLFRRHRDPLGWR